MKPTATLLAFALTLAVGQADHHEKTHSLDPAGAWKAQAKSEDGTRDFTFTFEKKEDKWSGKSEDENDTERVIDRVKVDGNKLTLETDVEGDEQSGIIRVTFEANESGDKLEGKWAVIDSSDAERMSGEITAEKLYTLDLAGEWDAVATIGEEENTSVTAFKKDGDKWTGGFEGDDTEAKFSKVTTDGKRVVCEFILPIDGEDRDFRITAEAKGDDRLEGKWVVFDDSGQESYSGKWTAKRKSSFDLAGTWKAESEVNGETHNSTYTIEAKEDGYAGNVSSEAGSVALSSVKLDGEKVAITFPFGETDIAIKAEAKDGKLAGKWSATGGDGTEYSGKWSAEKK